MTTEVFGGNSEEQREKSLGTLLKETALEVEGVIKSGKEAVLAVTAGTAQTITDQDNLPGKINV